MVFEKSMAGVLVAILGLSVSYGDAPHIYIGDLAFAERDAFRRCGHACYYLMGIYGVWQDHVSSALGGLQHLETPFSSSIRLEDGGIEQKVVTLQDQIGHLHRAQLYSWAPTVNYQI